MNMCRSEERVAWIDVARCLGILAVYIGHFGEEAGLIYPFVFQFHVPLFFFLSGCVRKISNKPLRKSVQIATKRLLLPYVFFGGIYLFCFVLYNDSSDELLTQVLIFLKGAPRNQFAAGSLWFLTCLWVIETLFSLVQHLKPLILAIFAITLYILATKVLATNPLFFPRLWFNVDSAMAYFLYFTMGFLLFPCLRNLFQTQYSIKQGVVFHGLGFMSLAYAFLMYVSKSQLIIGWYTVIPGFDLWGTVLSTMLLIYAILYVARLLQHLKVLSRCGQDTLYLCGNEDLGRMVFPVVLKTFGLNVVILNPMSVIIYCTVLITLERLTLVPVEKVLLHRTAHLFETK